MTPRSRVHCPASCGRPARKTRPEGREGRRLDRHGHERRHRRGGALVDVRRPGLEGDEGHLEAQSHQHERDAEEHERFQGPRRDDVRDDVQARRAGRAVEERHPVEQEAAREGAQQEVLHRRLVRAQVAPQHAGQHVEAHRHGLEGDEEHDEVVGEDQEHHAGRGEQDQGVVVARRQAPLAYEVDRHEERQGRAQADHHGEEETVAIGAQHVLEGGRITVAGPRRDRHRHRGRQSDDAEAGEHAPAAVAQEEIDQHHDHRRAHDHDGGQRGLPVCREGADVDGRHPTR